MEIQQRQSILPNMRQDQVMTHRQIQALEFLSTPVLELQSIVNVELEKNPILEIGTEAPDSKSMEDDGDEWLDKVMKLEEDFRFIRPSPFHAPMEQDEKRQHYLESIESKKTLQESLSEQLRFFDLDLSLHNCCENVLSCLDDEGYLKSHPADLAMISGEPIEKISEAIRIVQQLDPPGVGANDLQDRLLIQLTRKNKEDSLTYVAVRDHLKAIANNHLPRVAKQMGTNIGQIKDIVDEIKSLTPRLGLADVEFQEYIKEEVEVFEEEDGFSVKVVNDHLPSLFINQHYRSLMEDPGTPKEVKNYVRDKIRSGIHLINSIIQRQTTILKTVNAILDEQEGYFRFGTKYLKPMTMAKIAEKVGVHETTISRAVSGKYLRCRFGLIPLRNFFSTGYSTNNGKSVSNVVVKKAISALIEKEDPYAPLSDSTIGKMLQRQDFEIARRTVAKYRESLGILSSNLRRKFPSKK